jgi:hypothetical protein
MILFFNNSPGAFVPDSIQTGIDRIIEQVRFRARSLRIPEKKWDGDKIQVQKQFPKWVQTGYQNLPSKVPSIDFFINYYRWLFDLEEGYGCGFYLEDLRNISNIPERFLQGYADVIFAGQLDLDVYPELKENFRKCLLTYHRDYIKIKGTPEGMEYILKSLFGATFAQVSTSYGTNIRVVTDMNSNYQNLFKLLACPFSFDVIFASP